GDEADEKGFYLVEIEPDKASGQRQVAFEFQPVSGRRFLTINVALEPEDIDPTATVLGAIAGQAENIKEAIVRLNITLPAQLEGQLRGDIREALKEAYFATVARETQREARLRLGQFTAEEITPLEALKKYLESKKTPPERTKVLMEYGERLIRGET
ncbi:MAG TPA: DNA double-strand break repair protein Mre11, partial [Dehalococcoidales bacterium]|nr:DNA double-strand break repair protein Mre11 [Dehalococcoidales bacterium]